ncbi:MAG TPA: type II secretion system F family protein [Candidatus Saccharimonadales bacterium]|nr:type II secretion system F family protein [Candidatus Saccharimonadales bacterium]
MVLMIVAVVLTFVLSLALLLLLLSERSPLTARLTAIAAQPVETVAPKSGIEVASRFTEFFAPVRKLLGLADDGEISRRMAAAGYRERGYVDLYYTVKLLGPVVAGLIAGFLLRGENVFIYFLVLGAIGYLWPDFWLTGAVTRRRERIRLAMPDALDLLVICMEAGLGMDQALIRIGEELRLGHKDLSDELLLIRLEQRAGKPRIEAWRNMANRTGLEVCRSFVNMLVQTERFGTPLSKSLGYFADSIRTRRRQQAEEMAAKTTVKLVFPLVFFIFPSMFIVLLVPAILAISKSFVDNFGH